MFRNLSQERSDARSSVILSKLIHFWGRNSLVCRVTMLHGGWPGNNGSITARYKNFMMSILAVGQYRPFSVGAWSSFPRM
jgi:hypothetical protein